MLLRSVIVLLLLFNLLVLSWTAGIFSRWGWGPTHTPAQVQAQPPIQAEAFKLRDVQSSVKPTPTPSAPPTSVQ